MKWNVKRLAAAILAVVLLACTYDCPEAAAAPKETGTNSNVYHGDGYEVLFEVKSSWNAGYSADITIHNTGDIKIEDWCITFSLANRITDIWNAEVNKEEAGIYIVKNAGWNQDIEGHGSVSFGFTAEGAFSGFPGSYSMQGRVISLPKEAYSVEYKVESEWTDGFSAKISITNNTDGVLEDWSLEFDFNSEILSVWDAGIADTGKNHYVIHNNGYNSNIASGQTVSFGFLGSGGDGNGPQNIKVSTCTADSYQGDNPDIDTDGDGLTDLAETILGTDYQNPDSDGDGLTDYYEYTKCGTNPLEQDTDGDGILDPESDEDKDGITNEAELVYATDPLVADSDNDGLNDFEEIRLHETDPLAADTDQDGLSDYDDVALGFSPLKADTDDNGIIDADEIVKQTFSQEITEEEKPEVTNISVTLETNGNIEHMASITNLYQVDKRSADLVGLVGVPVGIHCNSDFKEAVITFTYDKTLLGDTDADNLAVMWYDEENDWYQILDQDSVVDEEKCTVSYTAAHFSTYMLVDKTKWYEAWRENLDYRKPGGSHAAYFDFAFVADTSGSMAGTRIQTAKEALGHFINTMSKKDQACLISFTSAASVVTAFTNSKAALMRGISSLSASGGTNVNNGLLMALAQFDKRKDSVNQKVIVLLCDGDVNYYEATINQGISENIRIFAVNVGSSSAGKYLEKMAELTGGEYYYCPTAGTIETVFASIRGETLDFVDPTDTDGDGLYDVYETVGLKLNNGRILNTDPKKADTDGDGLSDYEETGIVYTIHDVSVGNGKKVSVKCVLMASDPTSRDTDGDGQKDPDDKRPWSYDKRNVFIYQSAKKKGVDKKGETAGDLTYKDLSREQILGIGSQFKYQLDEADSPSWGADTLFAEFEDMSTSMFARGKLKRVIIDMIQHFKSGTGTDYANEDLTEAAVAHTTTQTYVKKLKNKVIEILQLNAGNVGALEYDEKTRNKKSSLYSWVQKNTARPLFHEASDIINGLKYSLQGTTQGNGLTGSILPVRFSM